MALCPHAGRGGVDYPYFLQPEAPSTVSCTIISCKQGGKVPKKQTTHGCWDTREKSSQRRDWPEMCMSHPWRSVEGGKSALPWESEPQTCPHANLRSEFTLSIWSREVKPEMYLKWSGCQCPRSDQQACILSRELGVNPS